MAIQKSSRARGGNRGGIGGGYEITDPDYDQHRIERMRREYDELPIQWRSTYLKGLTKQEQKLIRNRQQD